MATKLRTRLVMAAVMLAAVPALPPGIAAAGPSAVEQAALPIPPRTRPVVAEAGADVIVFGGGDASSRQRGVPLPRNDGALFHRATGTWRTIAAAPFRPPLYEPSGVVIDGTLVVAGTPCADTRQPGTDSVACRPGGTAVGAYRLATNSWRLLPAPPGSTPDRISTVVGRRGSAAVVRVGPDKLWLLDPGTVRWSSLADPPLTGRFCVQDQTLIAIAAEPAPAIPTTVGVAAALTPPDRLFTATLAGAGGWSPTRAVPVKAADALCDRPSAAVLAATEAATAEPRPEADPALTDLVRRIDTRQQAAAAGPTAWFHEFNMAGNALNHGSRAPADAVVFIVAAARNRPFAIALNEVCIDWTDPESQVRVVQDELGEIGYTLLANITQTVPDRKSCPQFGNVIVHVGNRDPYPRSFQFWYGNQAPADEQKAERRGGVCARVNAFWVFFACSSHLTPSDEMANILVTHRFYQSASYYGLSSWQDPPGPDIDPAIPAVRAGDLNSTPGSTEMSGWESDESPWVEGDDALHRPTSDSGRKIDYIFASHTTGFSAAEVSGDLVQSDHRYYTAVFSFVR